MPVGDPGPSDPSDFHPESFGDRGAGDGPWGYATHSRSSLDVA